MYIEQTADYIKAVIKDLNELNNKLKTREIEDKINKCNNVLNDDMLLYEYSLYYRLLIIQLKTQNLKHYEEIPKKYNKELDVIMTKFEKIYTKEYFDSKAALMHFGNPPSKPYEFYDLHCKLDELNYYNTNVMKIIKKETEFGTNVFLIEEDKSMSITFGGNGDLY